MLLKISDNYRSFLSSKVASEVDRGEPGSVSPITPVSSRGGEFPCHCGVESYMRRVSDRMTCVDVAGMYVYW